MNDGHLPSYSVFTSFCAEETEDLARKFAAKLKQGDVLLLEGALGAGKTTFAKALISSLTKTDTHLISSPTFTYMNQYSANICVNHFDLYRIEHPAQAEALGLLDFIGDECISIIEWPQKLPAIASMATFTICLSYVDAATRTLTIQCHTK